MTPADRRTAILDLLRDGGRHRAADLARGMGVTERTLHRDVAALRAAGAPIRGTPGSGLVLGAHVGLPQMHLTPDEFDALTLGLSIVAEAGDADLAPAARALLARIAAPGPTATPLPPATPLPALPHLATLRRAIASRQKVALTLAGPDGRSRRVVHPVRLHFAGGAWSLTGACDRDGSPVEIPLAAIARADPLAELYR